MKSCKVYEDIENSEPHDNPEMKKLSDNKLKESVVDTISDKLKCKTCQV